MSENRLTISRCSDFDIVMDDGDLSEYLDRLGIDAAASAWDLKRVEKLQQAHIAQFPFSNIGVLLGSELSLEAQAIFERIVRRGHGGYCFEHNKLFFEVLQAVGFRVRLALGRVLLHRPVAAPLTHRVTILEFDGDEYLIDVGFGPLSPRGPLLMSRAMTTDHGGFVYRLSRDEHGAFAVQSKLNGEFSTLYAFELTRYTDIDCELGHFYSSKHPDAAFVNNLVVSRIEDGVAHSLRNTVYRRFDARGFEDLPIDDAAALRSRLREVFQRELSQEQCERLFEVARRAAS